MFKIEVVQLGKVFQAVFGMHIIVHHITPVARIIKAAITVKITSFIVLPNLAYRFLATSSGSIFLQVVAL